MCEQTIEVLSFDALSEQAKQAAYAHWYEQVGRNTSHENQWVDSLLNILSHFNIHVPSWHYSDTDHGFVLDDSYIDPKVCRQSMTDVTGLPATKLATRLYYALTEKQYAWRMDKTPTRVSMDYVEHTGADANNAKHYDSTCTPLTDKQGDFLANEIISTCIHSGFKTRYLVRKNTVYMPAIEKYFDGTYLGCTFAQALWRHIRACPNDRYYDHVYAALEAVFEELEAQNRVEVSYQNFIEMCASDYEYTEDGALL